ncbi:MAG TPA: phenylacetate--CoA ligase family protein, partial [Gemmatales bacterium]|nr:phenylacetate--CoA ligase family protein [Gemmatales bacterium]
GRTDDMLLVKGNNFYPSMIESIVREHSAIHEFQIVTDARRPGELQLRLELRGNASADQVKQKVLEAFKNRYHFRPEIEFVTGGTLPRSEMKSSRVVRLK